MNPQILRGLVDAIPIMLAYVFLAFSYGVSSAHDSLSLFSTLLMSLIVYAGSAQMIAVGLFAAGESAASLVVMAFILNLRHMLLGAALIPYLSGWSRIRQSVFSLELTDETFAVHSAAFRLDGANFWRASATNVSCQISWIAGTVIGHVTHNALPRLDQLGLDFALPAMFIALLVLQIRTRNLVFVSILSGALGLYFRYSDFGGTSTILAALIGASFGLGLEKWMKRPST